MPWRYVKALFGWRGDKYALLNVRRLFFSAAGGSLLTLPQIRIHSALRQQCIMPAALNDNSTIKDDDFVLS